MSNWICYLFPRLCSPRPAPEGPTGDPLRLPEWLRALIAALNDAQYPPTAEELSTLANGLLAAGYADAALEVTTAVLRDPDRFQLNLDPLTQANLQLIGAKSATGTSADNMQIGRDLIQAMPSSYDLEEALKPGNGPP